MPAGSEHLLRWQVLAMNKAFAEEQKALSGMDTSSRHLLGQRQDVTAAPWNVAQAGHKVRPPKLASALT